MKYIDEARIWDLLKTGRRAGIEDIAGILRKSRALERLTLSEAAALLRAEDPESLNLIFEAARCVKNAVYGSRVVLFTPLYISNFCSNGCVYCAFQANNTGIERRQLSEKEILEETQWLLSRGHKRILMVAGEKAPAGTSTIEYYTQSIRAIYSAKVGANNIRRVNVNVAPLSTAEFRELKRAGIGTYQLFQETYHDATYRQVHPYGSKSDPDERLDAIDRAFLAGIDDVGIGALYGLYDYRFETLALLMHIGHLENKHRVGPHTISVPRIEPAGVAFTEQVPHRVSDGEFKKLVAVLRLAVPYTGIILSTRETPAMRNELFTLGVSQVSAESCTSPGAHTPGGNNGNAGTQFTLNDHRSLDEVIDALMARDLIPSFCTACYRTHRTGEAFMNLARPGTIQGKCRLNALVTLREYLDDFASSAVKKKGYELINRVRETLDEEDKKRLSVFFEDIAKGARDEYV
ncbi:MAG: [FeFe] hydrogenase H-cluster radical SAM maturase HydG [Candidatus Omnitrophica bacterium]|nr:[FeFe] hydrogenase H-cluster radical SAM maturase HydG [Candidatus Omnitrophota bacterium]